MLRVTKNLDVAVDVTLNDIYTDDLISELEDRGYEVVGDSTDPSGISSHILTTELISRGYHITRYVPLDDYDLDVLMEQCSSYKPGSHLHAIYTKLSEMRSDSSREGL